VPTSNALSKPLNWGQSAQAPAPGTVSLTVALKALENRRIALSQQHRKLFEWMGKGAVIPCQVLAAYNRGVANYYQTARAVFDQVDKLGYHVNQVLRGPDGTTIKETDGKAQMVALRDPLKPPIFKPKPEARCPDIFVPDFVPPQAQALVAGGLGVAAALGPALATLGRFLLSGRFLIASTVVTTAFMAKEIADKTAVILHGWNVKPDEQVNAFDKCVQGLIDKGIPPAQAVAKCGDVVPHSNKAAVVLLVAAVTVGAALAVWLVAKEVRKGQLSGEDQEPDNEEDAETGYDEAVQYIPPPGR
jgi:hypothetical protein